MVRAKKNTPEHLDIMEVIRAENSKNTKYPINLSRFNFKINSENCIKFTSYSKIAKRLINDYKKNNLKANEFHFNADVFRVLRHQLKLKA